ncbi:MAG: bifunctional DNA primase/polymerase [Xanthobacteraceae bacterium]
MSLDLALEYVARGWPVFPCRERAEDVPDPHTGELELLNVKTPYVSNGFRGASVTDRVVRRYWADHPEAMVGVPTGAKIGAWVLDIDVKVGVDGYETLAALEAEHGPLPATAVATTAGGGKHFYWRHVDGIRNRAKLGPGIDVRGEGGYVVAPGSIMADGRAYFWVDDNTEIADAPQWLLDHLLKPQGAAPAARDATRTTYQPGAPRSDGINPPYVSAAVEAELGKLGSSIQGERGAQLNTSAFVLGTLVGAGALSRVDAEHGLYAAARQCGVLSKDGERETRAKIKRGLDSGLRNPRAIPEPDHHHDNTPIIPATRLIEAFRAKVRARNAVPLAELEEMTEDELEEFAISASSSLEELTYPGGFVEELIDWIVSSADHPSRPLALAAVLPFVASLMGSRYATGSRETRPNIYTVALAESGFGKDHARSQIKRLLMPGVSKRLFDRFGGPSRIMSASALREVLETNSSVNCQIDEFGGFVRNITDRRASSHQLTISTDLRDYYSASSTFFEGAVYRGAPAKRIYNPNLCIHGTSTPDQFWTALSSASAEDGLLPRLVLFHVDGKKPEEVVPERDVSDVPGEILLRMAGIAGIDVVASRALKQVQRDVGAEPIKAKMVPWSDEASIVFAQVKRRLDDVETSVAPEARPFVRRIIENMVKLALIVSVGQNHDRPVVSGPTMEWAASTAWTCAATMIKQVSEKMADNQREANHKKIAGLIRDAAGKGITRGKLADRLKGIDARQRDEIVTDLRAAGHVVEVKTEGVGRPSIRLFWRTTKGYLSSTNSD